MSKISSQYIISRGGRGVETQKGKGFRSTKKNYRKKRKIYNMISQKKIVS
jgi:hypothetical protein